MSVVDASLVVRLLAAVPQDQPIRNRLADPVDLLYAPDHIEIEVLSAVAGLLKGGVIDADRAGLMIDDFAALTITLHPVLQLSARILELRHNFTAYDAAYLALAERIGQPLLTTDTKFAAAPDAVHRARIETF